MSRPRRRVARDLLGDLLTRSGTPARVVREAQLVLHELVVNGVRHGSADDRGEIGVNHVAYTYANVGDLMATYGRLKRAGITPYWPVHHGTTLSVYYADPDGNRMEFQVDCGTVEEATELMRTPGFAENPVGVMYDPDALFARFEAGEPEEALIAMPDGPPSPIPAAHGMT